MLTPIVVSLLVINMISPRIERMVLNLQNKEKLVVQSKNVSYEKEMCCFESQEDWNRQ